MARHLTKIGELNRVYKVVTNKEKDTFIQECIDKIKGLPNISEA